MRRARPARFLCAGAVIAALAAALPSAAGAEEVVTPRDRITDDSAYVLEPGEARIGLWRAGFGMPAGALRGLEIDTYILPWIAWAFKLQVINFQAEYQFLRRERFAASASLGFFHLDLERFHVPARFFGTPFSLLGAFRAASFLTLGGGLEGVYIHADGHYVKDGKHEDYFQGGIAVNNLTVLGTVEWRLSNVFSVVAHGRLLAYQSANAVAEARVRVNPATAVEIYADGEGELTKGLGSLVGAYVHMAWEHFNLKLGANYGNYSLPAIHFVLPMKVFVPEIDFYWRF